MMIRGLRNGWMDGDEWVSDGWTIDLEDEGLMD